MPGGRRGRLKGSPAARGMRPSSSELADDLGHTSKTERVLRVKRKVQTIGAVVSGPTMEPVTDTDLILLSGELAEALWRCGQLVLPDCWKLVIALSEAFSDLHAPPVAPMAPTLSPAGPELLAALTRRRWRRLSGRSNRNPDSDPGRRSPLLGSHRGKDAGSPGLRPGPRAADFTLMSHYAPQSRRVRRWPTSSWRRSLSRPATPRRRERLPSTRLRACPEVARGLPHAFTRGPRPPTARASVILSISPGATPKRNVEWPSHAHLGEGPNEVFHKPRMR